MRIGEQEGSDRKKNTLDLADATYILHRGQYRRRETGRSRTNGGRAKWSWQRAIKLVLRGSVAMGIEREMKQSGP